jgi:hypothetical protein
MKYVLLTAAAVVALLAGSVTASAQTKEQTGISRETGKQVQQQSGVTRAARAQPTKYKRHSGFAVYQYRSAKAARTTRAKTKVKGQAAVVLPTRAERE